VSAASPVLLGPQEAQNQRLLERLRLAGTIVAAGVFAVFVGELILRPGVRPGVSLAQGANLVVCALVLGLVRVPSQRARNLRLGFLCYAVTTICTGAVGIFARDPTTSIIIIVAEALGAAAIVPWGPWWQLAGVVLSTVVAIWTVSTLVPEPEFLLQNIGSIMPTLTATVFLAHILRRESALVARTEHERNTREAILRDSNGRLEREVEQHRRTEEMLRFTLRELDHRVKNTLAIVQSVAQRTLESSQSREEFSQAFYGRIQAMARIHTALAATKWKGLELRELFELTVGPYRPHADSVSIECDRAAVSSDLVRILGMALHELATNAAKYGALSTGEGRVVLASRLESAGDASRLHIVWKEAHGPAVEEPQRRGLGTKLIQEGLVYESGGTVELAFLPSGVCCEIDVPLPAAR
jgi:two-component sensor histidine kinase